MNSAKIIRQQVKRFPVGKPFTPYEFLHLGSRSTIDRQLFQLNKAGRIMRVARGVYVRPKENKFVGKVPPGAFEIARIKAGPAGVKIAPNGAEAALLFGLTTQMPVRPVYYTTGLPKQFRFGQQYITLKPVSSRRLAMAGTKTGLAISALWYLGQKEVTPEIIGKVKKQLSSEEYEQLKHSQALMPGWLGSAINNFEHKEHHAS